jgi:anti-anti-sigma factor
MSIKCEEYGNICVMALSGDFAGEVTQAARKAVEERIEQRQIVDYVIDFEKCPFIDSDGLETLLWIKHRCEDLFGQIKLAHLDENCRKILEMTRLEPRFEAHTDLPQALKTMR